MSLFVNYFSYSVDQFDQLTIPQAYRILDQRKTIETNRYDFWLNEFRKNSYFTYISTNGQKQIKQPSDLYPLPFDKKEKEFTDSQIEFFNRRLTPEEQRLIGAN